MVTNLLALNILVVVGFLQLSVFYSYVVSFFTVVGFLQLWVVQKCYWVSAFGEPVPGMHACTVVVYKFIDKYK